MQIFSRTGPDAEENSVFLSITQILEGRSRQNPDGSALSFYYDDAEPVAVSRCDTWNWAELWNRSLVVFRELREAGLAQAGARILVVYPPGAGFIAAFLGCLCAGAIPVPVPAPRRSDGINRWLHIARDAEISGILCLPALVEILAPLHEVAGAGKCLSPSGAEADVHCPENVAGTAVFEHQPDDIAFLQYTSGSTSDPKGVMVTHGNLMSNLEQMRIAAGYTAADRSACWLPHYHDMGLIDGILSAVYNGFPVALMAPASFLRRPMRFLELASHIRATIMGGPNFSYEHCVGRFTDDVAENLDLSSIRLAYSGAEPVRPQTLRRFAETFAPSGFRQNAFFCCYGQAETTLFVSGNRSEEPPVVLSVKRDTLVATGEAVAADEQTAGGDILELAACGRTAQGLDVEAVDPEQHRSVGENRVGEIWVRGPNVTPGYWKRPEETAATFNRTLEGTDGWRRTGDLGFRMGGQLYITGRLKDLIIIRGQNHHPEDIEQTVFSCHPALAQGRAGAFSLEKDGEEQLGVICELTREGVRDLDTGAVIQAIRGALSASHGLVAAVIALIRPGSLPRTTSGKVRRFACREALESGDLRIVARQDADFSVAENEAEAADRPTWLEQLRSNPQSRIREGLRQKIREEVALLSRLPAGELPASNIAFFELGLDSLALVNLGTTLEKELGLALSPTLIFEHPDIDTLTDHLTGLLDTGRAARTPPAPETREQAKETAPAGHTSSAIAAELAALRSLLGTDT